MIDLNDIICGYPLSRRVIDSFPFYYILGDPMLQYQSSHVASVVDSTPESMTLQLME